MIKVLFFTDTQYRQLIKQELRDISHHQTTLIIIRVWIYVTIISQLHLHITRWTKFQKRNLLMLMQIILDCSHYQLLFDRRIFRFCICLSRANYEWWWLSIHARLVFFRVLTCSFSVGVDICQCKTLQFNLMQWPYDFIVALTTLNILAKDLIYPGQQFPIPLKRNQTISSDNVAHLKVSLIWCKSCFDNKINLRSWKHVPSEYCKIKPSFLTC